jgi:hypothetical protein
MESKQEGIYGINILTPRIRPGYQTRFRRDETREPRDVDLFLHVRALSPEEQLSQGAKNYLKATEEAVRRSRFPIMILPGRLKDFPEVPELWSIGYQLTQTGKISEDTAVQLGDLLGGFNKKDRFRIHGAYLGACTSELAVQLYGLVERDIYWPDFLDMRTERPIECLREESRLRIEKLLRERALGRSNIRLGNVFARSQKDSELVRQITDSRTRIFRID